VSAPDRAPPPAAAQLLAFLEPFRGAFRRSDQFHWAAVYLRGLLTPGGRKTVEHIARTAAEGSGRGAGPIAQALQHFLNSSPWDEECLLRGLRERLLPLRRPEGLLVVAEWAFVKQGRHSVGVQRQYSSSLGRKVGCQVAFALMHVGQAGCWPLAVRLYLPRAWQQDLVRLEAGGVPGPWQKPFTRSALSATLLQDLTGEQLPEHALACTAGVAEDLAAAAGRAGLACLPALPADAALALEGCARQLRELGLDHFEGRSWRGFHHHAALVLLAHAIAGGRGRQALDGVKPSVLFCTRHSRNTLDNDQADERAHE
jgi:SRSO17 transposase